jgi:hypothetical protein
MYYFTGPTDGFVAVAGVTTDGYTLSTEAFGYNSTGFGSPGPSMTSEMDIDVAGMLDQLVVCGKAIFYLPKP